MSAALLRAVDDLAERCGALERDHQAGCDVRSAVAQLRAETDTLASRVSALLAAEEASK